MRACVCRPRTRRPHCPFCPLGLADTSLWKCCITRCKPNSFLSTRAVSDDESTFIALPGWLLNSLTFCMLLERRIFAVIHSSCISLEVSSLTSTEEDLMYGLQKIIALCHRVKFPTRVKYSWGKPFKMKLLIASFIVTLFPWLNSNSLPTDDDFSLLFHDYHSIRSCSPPTPSPGKGSQ